MAGLRRLLSLTPGHPQRPIVATLIVLVLASPWVGIARFAAGDSDGGLVAFVAGSMLAVLLLVILIAGWFTGREMPRLLAGEAWARWRLDREEWIRHVERDWPGARGADLGEGARLLARPLGLVLIGLAGLEALKIGQPWSIPPEYRAVIYGLLGVVLAVRIAPAVAAHVRYARRKRVDVAEVVIGPRGVYAGGQYSYLIASGSRLVAARVEPGTPAVLHLEVHRPTRWGVERQATRVPVPRLALRDEGGWIEPGDYDRYGAALRGYVRDRSLRPSSFAYGAGGWIGEAGAVLLLVLVVGRLDAGATTVQTAVSWSLISTVLYVLVDLAETRRDRRPAGDATSLWTDSPVGTVALLASFVSIKLAAMGWLG